MTTTDHAVPPLPETRPIAFDDVKQALGAGLDDFRRAPVHGLFFGLVFSAIGILIAWLLMVKASSYWVLPIAAGFPLIGPFAAVGLYEISRRLEQGEPLIWGAILTVIWRKPGAQLPFYAFIAIFVFMVWVYLAHLIFALTFGLKPLTNVMTSMDLLLSVEGITMLVIGTIVGGALAALMFVVSVISVPMFLDREIDVVSAMVTSVKAVLQSPQALFGWGVIIVVASVVAMVPLFLGMIIVFPVLGHASWHLYKRTVETV